MALCACVGVAVEKGDRLEREGRRVDARKREGETFSLMLNLLN